MAYNDQNYVRGIPPGTQSEGVITEIRDGTVKDFISEAGRQKWKSPLDAKAILLVCQGKYGDIVVNVQKLFTYSEDTQGRTVLSGNLARFERFYGRLPKVGMVVRLEFGVEGFWNLKYG